MPEPFPRHFRLVHAQLASVTGKPVPLDELRSLGDQFRKALDDESMPARHEELFRFAVLTYVAQRDGHEAFAASCLQWLEPEVGKLDNRLLDGMLTVVRANQMRIAGKVQDGIDLLRPQLDGSELLQARVVMRDLERAAGNVAAVAEQEGWLRAHRGQALGEVAVAQRLQPLNVSDVSSAAAHSAAGSH